MDVLNIHDGLESRQRGMSRMLGMGGLSPIMVVSRAMFYQDFFSCGESLHSDSRSFEALSVRPRAGLRKGPQQPPNVVFLLF